MTPLPVPTLHDPLPQLLHLDIPAQVAALCQVVGITLDHNSPEQGPLMHLSLRLTRAETPPHSLIRLLEHSRTLVNRYSALLMDWEAAERSSLPQGGASLLSAYWHQPGKTHLQWVLEALGLEQVYLAAPEAVETEVHQLLAFTQPLRQNSAQAQA